MLMVEFAVSHQLADGASYYTLSDHITQYAKGATPPVLNWPVCSENGFLNPQATDSDKDMVLVPPCTRPVHAPSLCNGENN